MNTEKRQKLRSIFDQNTDESNECADDSEKGDDEFYAITGRHKPNFPIKYLIRTESIIQPVKRANSPLLDQSKTKSVTVIC